MSHEIDNNRGQDTLLMNSTLSAIVSIRGTLGSVLLSANLLTYGNVRVRVRESKSKSKKTLFEVGQCKKTTLALT